jgi:[acyl-carrier-protein] S-malonyltransferase
VRPPAVTLLSNAAGERVFTGDQASNALAQQIARTVQWAACLDAMHARRLDCVLEIGPGAALATAWARRFPDTPARSVDEFRSASAVVDWVLRQV